MYVSIDADGHDIHQRSKTRYYAEGSDENTKGISFFKPHLPFYYTWKWKYSNIGIKFPNRVRNLCRLVFIFCEEMIPFRVG